MANIIVLIPHYNNFKSLIKSIQSINENIEVDILIVDDGSQQDKIEKEKIEKIYNIGKIFFDFLPQNRGIEFALNRGLQIIETMGYDLIGRLDCGDLCVENRFTIQTQFLEKNKDIYLVGTWANVLNSKGALEYVLKHPTQHNVIKKLMYLNSMFVHPSVVFRSKVVKEVGYYPTTYKAAEDYAFFFNIARKFKTANLPIPLLNYVIDENSISSLKRKTQVKSRIRVILSNFYFGYYPVYGLLRNMFLFFISRETSNFIKKHLMK